MSERLMIPKMSERAYPTTWDATFTGLRRDRLSRAYQILDGIPEKRVDLFQFVKGPVDPDNTPTCGTIACGGGWLMMHPDMQRLGLVPCEDAGGAVMPSYGDIKYPFVALGTFFATEKSAASERCGESMFQSRGYGRWDNHILQEVLMMERNKQIDSMPVTDKALLLYRIGYAYDHHSS